MRSYRVLVVEDEADIRELIRFHLERAGFLVDVAEDGATALAAVRSRRPDLLLLDRMLPDMEGLEICRALKGDPATEGLAVVLVTARDRESDVITGLEQGADDYVTKPFSPRVLVSRVRAVLRRRSGDPAEAEVIRRGELVIDPARHRVLWREKSLELTVTEFRILHLLASRAGRVFSREQIVDAVHGADYPVTPRSVDVQIAGLRRKLGPAAARIRTVRGVGYAFEE